jgi:hypothetical protein
LKALMILASFCQKTLLIFTNSEICPEGAIVECSPFERATRDHSRAPLNHAEVCLGFAQAILPERRKD